ncbi:glutathione S-transferase family protein [Caulobacter sp. CCH9-E1]|jgi:glutathione S-transferase|uniref:glutathione S-transferase family protein n=1 Tax=Caulobacter sp. CCH9-E1 TaxID=1768768 RepID=UPI000AA07628|nr:glutathione S-transferase [Caulobacter sp. CCH9-E1]
MSMTLYNFPLSGHSHRARLFLSLLGEKADIVDVDLAQGEHKSPTFLAMNSLGQVPVLQDGTTSIADSNAILVYLAKKAGRTDWLPETPEEAARVQRWLSIAAGEIASGPASARLITLFGAKLDPERTIAKAHAILKVMDDELARSDYLAGSRPTIADVAAYSYVAHAPEGNVALDDYGAVRAWIARIEALPGFVPMPISRVGLRA